MSLIMTVESSWKGLDTFQKWCDCIVPALLYCIQYEYTANT